MTYKVFANENLILVELERMKNASKISEKNNMYKIAWTM